MAEHQNPKRIRRTAAAPSQYHPKHMRVGAWGERTACAILASLGYRIIERNWRPSPESNPERIRGEIDAIAISPEDELVIIEVKTRSSLDFGHPLTAFNRDKGKRTRQLAFMWAGQQEHLDFRLMRVDAVAVTGTPEHFTFEHAKAVA
ncbi:MAG: YraN family protein [Rothia sp. (in: high G+C Gram-positive bacteria)]|uniref:YraN family protein n=1 Tax=Rothia sp. (in: high G+C Gram-positive bacteria) TaxID=1885016 RepID=UPI0026E028C7|nr:YraN family protein [Rothia sp. (in: high G+C Gram-positive bacteria)]MDO5750849.1 YraN family protein [Rothia sp. (in: high G+C Gram-positive bacteria)]